MVRFFFSGAAWGWAVYRLLEDANDVEILLIQQDPLLFQIMADDSFLLADGPRTAVDLL